MYNRYIRNDKGVYTRIFESDEIPDRPHTHDEPVQKPEHGHPPNTPPKTPPHHGGDSFSGTLRKLLDRFHLENIDTGDLLLLLLILLLFREDADDELLFALGLLLIL